MMYLAEKHCLKVLKELEKLKIKREIPLNQIMCMGGDIRGREDIAMDSPLLTTYEPGSSWGQDGKNHLFRMDFHVPGDLEGEALFFSVETGGDGKWDMARNPQFMLFINGSPWQGLDKGHTSSMMTQAAKAGEIHRIALDGFPGMKEGGLRMQCKVLVWDLQVERLYYNIKIPSDMVPRIKDDKTRSDILNHLETAMGIIDFRKPRSTHFYSSVEKANHYMEEEFYGSFCGNSSGVVKGVGHTHIDVAWLWPISQTRQKVVRSFSTVLHLMDLYPEYLFMSSQPQLYQFIKEDRPDIYEKIRQRVREGRWEPEGGMWLEADCNLASGEAFVRQFLYGCRFFKEEFNAECRVLWLPDVFGYSAALPQIMKKSNIEYFMTTKIFWNEYNRFPYETFEWEGIDGSKVLAHFITATDTQDPARRYGSTYNGVLSTPHVFGAFENYHQKGINDTVLMSFGYGDGGGGPTREMLEEGRRLGKGVPGAPKFEMTTSRDFFEELDRKVRDNKRLPKWVGELYLEYHRGTYTSVGRNKRNNRKSEFLLREVELFGYFAGQEGLMDYPEASLKENWERVLLHQFHDILPGSSIREVYEDSDADYSTVFDQGGRMLEERLHALAAKASDGKDQCVVFNSLSFNRKDIARVEVKKVFTHALTPENEHIQGQMVWEDGKMYFLFTAEVPSMGYRTYSLERKTQSVDAPLQVSPQAMENRFFRIEFDASMGIISLLDKRNGRQLVRENQKANQLIAFEDKPINWDAWDINIYYNDKSWEIDEVLETEVMETGPVRGSLRIKRKFLDSVISQTIQIYADVPRVDFDTEIDWQETDILLKAAFPMDIHTSKATYEIQYGNVERPTHWNTSWDYARFEVSAHKWADISESGYGVSLLNDCKYGHDIKDSVMRLTLLKSAAYPNPVADIGNHRMVYSLYPHMDDFKKGGTVDMAYMLNCPLRGVFVDEGTGDSGKSKSFIGLDKENVVIEAVKKAEDGEKLIVRVYECFNRRDTVEMAFHRNIREAMECNLLEEDTEAASYSGNMIRFEIKPFEIRTFKVELE
ncbi:MAG: alpha-mannosidase [Clostridia bacterium]